MYAALTFLLATTSPAVAGCDAPTLLGLIDDAETAFAQMNATSFEESAAEVDRVLLCQEDALTTVQCAAYHRLKALEAFLREDRAATALSFRAAQAAQPGWTLSTAIAPEGHPLREQFEVARQLAAGPTIELDEPATGWLAIDGLRTRQAPSERSFVFQQFSRDGEVLQTAYVAPGSPLPTYPVRAVPPPVAKPRSPLKPVLFGSGLTLGVAAAAMYGGAFVSRSAYDEAVIAGDEERIRATRGTTNGLVIGGVSALGAGATLVVVGGLLD